MKKFVSGLLIGGILIFCVGVLAQNMEIVIEKLPLKYIFNGVEKTPLDGEEGFIYNDRTYVPIRFVAEAMDKNVEWEEDNYTINISDKKEADVTEYKWYTPLLKDAGVTEEECNIRLIGSFENYIVAEVSVNKGNENDWYVKLYRCESDGEEVMLISDTQQYLGGFNYAVFDNYCIFNKLDEHNNKYLEIKDITTLEVTATINNSYDEYIYDGSVIYMVHEDKKCELRILSPENGFVKTIKSFPEEADLKLFEKGKYLHIMCTDIENTKIYYYEIW